MGFRVNRAAGASAPSHPLAIDRTPALAHLARLRVTGVLKEPAQMYPTAGGGAFLLVKLQPAQGLPYHARVDLGTDLTDHMAAEAEIPSLRAGVLLSLAGDGLRLQTDHGNAVLWVLGACDAVAFHDPIPSPTHV